MWCIPKVTPEFIERMEHLLALYAKPYDPDQPVLCFDEQSKQLLADTRPVQLTKEGEPRHRDYEYKRNGTRNIFMAVEPKGGWRDVAMTRRRTKKDFAHEIRRLTELPRFATAKRIHIVLDNLNTHFPSSLEETLDPLVAKSLMERITFHYTPKHASWLNMAEIELSILSRQATKGRIPTEAALAERIERWQKTRNTRGEKIQWKFTNKDARKTFRYERVGN